MNKKRIISAAVIILILCAAVGWCVYEINSSIHASEISLDEAEKIVNEQFDKIAISKSSKYIAEENSISVNDISYGDEKNVILNCTIDTIDVHGAISPRYDEFLGADIKKKNGTMFKSALDFKLEFEEIILEGLKGAEKTEKTAELMLYETKNGFEIYADDEAINAVFGGISDIEKEVSEKKTVTKTMPNGAIREQKIESTNVAKGFIECFDTRSSIAKPETDKGIVKIWKSIKSDFEVNFLKYDRWKTIFKGLWVTIKLTIFALIIGLFLGILIAFVRSTYLKTTKHGILLRFFNKIAGIYLTVIRGTPAVVQIMIIYFVIFMPLGVDKFISAVVCFGINSAAYVAEIVRGGIMSVDEGQTEAGRSLGFGYMQTMIYIVFPQAFKAVLPALANEFVVLLKETSVAFYIGLGDLMYAGNAIRSATYSPFMPLVAVALIYLVMVMFLTMLVGKLERRLKTDGR
mgnify:CR=1 FL=1